MKEAGTSIDDLPPEVINRNIIPRLPVKNLFRCRSVYKNWRDVIDDPEFPIIHFNTVSATEIQNQSSIIMIPTLGTIPPRTKTDGAFLVEDYEAGGNNLVVTKMNLPYPEASSYNFEVFGCSNGMICFSTCNKFCRSGCSIYMCNPMGAEFLKLPDIGHKNWYGVSSGFGFDQSSKEFKVVKIYSVGGAEDEVKLYKGGSNSWKNVSFDREVCGLPNGKGAGMFFNGCVHWIAKDAIISFNMEFETFEVIQLPNFGFELFQHQRFLGLGVVRGCLCFSYRRTFNSPFEIYAMRVYKAENSWTRLALIREKVVGGIYVNAFNPIYYRRNGDLVLLCNFKFLVSYNPATRETTPLWADQLRHYAYSSARFVAFPYIGTLISPKPACLIGGLEEPKHNGGDQVEGHDEDTGE